MSDNSATGWIALGFRVQSAQHAVSSATKTRLDMTYLQRSYRSTALLVALLQPLLAPVTTGPVESIMVQHYCPDAPFKAEHAPFQLNVP